MQTPAVFDYITAEAAEPQAGTMIRYFVKYTMEQGSTMERASTRLTRHTESLLNRFWQEVNRLFTAENL